MARYGVYYNMTEQEEALWSRARLVDVKRRRRAFEDAVRVIPRGEFVALFEARAAHAGAKDACAGSGRTAERVAGFNSGPIAVQLPEVLPCPPHHYVLDAPGGPQVAGRCKKCGHERAWNSAGGEIDPIAVQLPEALPCPPHHYVLDSPNGPVIPGRCKRCGDERLWDASPGKIQFAEALGMSYTWVTARLDAQDRAAIRRERFERMLGAWE